MDDIHVFRNAEELSDLPEWATSVKGDDVADSDLADIGRHQGIEAVYLDGCAKLGDAALAHLAKLPALRELYITGGEITDAGLAHLAAHRGLVELGLDAPITGEGFGHLEGTPDLAEIHLPVCPRIEPANFAHLARLPALTKLCFYACRRMTDAWLDHLRGIGSLRILALKNCPGVSGERASRLSTEIPGLVIERI